MHTADPAWGWTRAWILTIVSCLSMSSSPFSSWELPVCHLCPFNGGPLEKRATESSAHRLGCCYPWEDYLKDDDDDDDDDKMLTRGAQVTGVAVCSLCLTWISVSLRFYVRIGILKFIGREDWLTLAAMIVFTIFCSLLLACEKYGLGAHMYAIPDEMKITALQYVFICELFYVVTTAVTKLSIGVFYLRLASKQYQIRIIWTTLGVVMLFSTMYFFFLLFQCTPIDYLWNQYDVNWNAHGSCISSAILINVTYAHAAMSAVTDWSFGILPVFFVWKLKMNPRTKFSVILILSLGFFASTATIVRIVYIHQLQVHGDYSWNGINLVKWSMVEPAIGITAAAIATLRPLFAKFLTVAHPHPYAAPKHLLTSSSSSTTFRESSSSEEGRKGRQSDQGYTVEFAQMLGLERYGVTTTIEATKPPGWRERRRAQRQNKLGGGFGDGSTTELNNYKNLESGWEKGIQTTTTVVIEG